MKKIIMSLCMLALAAVLFGTSTYAWFSLNRQVDAKGMKVSAKVESSLIVTEGNSSDSVLPKNSDKLFTVDFADSKYTQLQNSTHTTDADCKTVGLKTVSNPRVVDPTTGLKRTGDDPLKTGTDKSWDDISFAIASNTTSKTYYVDYIFYVAASLEKITGQDITISVKGYDGANKISDKNVNGAISVDVYYQALVTTPIAITTEQEKTAEKIADVSTSWTYAGALNLCGLDAAKNNGSDTKNDLTITGCEIPAATSDGKAAFAVLVRVYVDGNLYSSSAKTSTCVTTDGASAIKDIDLQVIFKVSDN